MRRILTSLLSLGLVFAACTVKDGNDYGPLTGPPNTIPDTDEPGDSGDTSDTGDTADTGETGETGETGVIDSADTGETGETGDTEPPVIVGTGYGEGDTAYNLEARDQNGDAWELYGEYGKVVVLIFGDSYSSGFTYMADYLDDIEEIYGGDVAVVSALVLNTSGYTAGESDARSFANTYGLSTVLYLLSAKDQVYWATGARPMTYLIDREMNIVRLQYGSIDPEDLQDLINSLL